MFLLSSEGLPWVLLPQPSVWSAAGTDTHILSRASRLPIARSTLTVTPQWEFHINTIRSCQDVLHDSNLGQNFTHFGQGRLSTFTQPRKGTYVNYVGKTAHTAKPALFYCF